MRNPNESEAAREARHRQEYAHSVQCQQARHEKELSELRKQLEDIMNENPDPRNWELIDTFEHDGYIVLKLRYPNCKNHKGEKVVVYKATLVQLIKQKMLDPHFGSVESTKLFNQPEGMIYPIARFPATDDGWNDAVQYVVTKTA